MPPRDSTPERQIVREAIRRARKITAMVQGTMGLEAQGLSPKFLHGLKKQTIRNLLAKQR
jgi:hypothetical protein